MCFIGLDPERSIVCTQETSIATARCKSLSFSPGQKAARLGLGITGLKSKLHHVKNR